MILEKKLQEAGTFDARITVLGHVQRGGFPTYFDRVLGSRMGAAAVEGLMNGKTAVMTGLQGNQIKFVPYEEVFSKRHELNNNIIKLLDDLA